MSERVIAERYVLTRAIGRGAMGHIWEAVDKKLQRKVALKLMAADHIASPTARARFEQEARAIAQLNNPHVVQVFDAGIDDGTPFIVMELLEGEDLDNRLNRVQRLPIGALVPIVKQAAQGLTAAQAQQIVHRDFKPANVFLARTDSNDEVVKILDFGVVSLLSGARDEELNITTAGSIVGTPLFMSPEQIRCGSVDHRSDLWSFAVLVYRALTGEHPFPGQWLGMLMVRICTDPFPPPSTVMPGLSPAVDAFFDRALAKDPDKRFQTAGQFATAFAALVDPRERGPSKILVVDDEPDVEALVRARFRQQIRKNIYQFVFASDGQAALEKLREHADIDVVLSDINMPGMDGLTFLSRVSESNPHVRTIMVSAYGDMGNIRTAMNRGAFDFVVKPIDFKDLEVTIEKTLKFVSDMRKNAQSSEENSVLRMFVSPSLLDHLRKTAPFFGIEAWQGTVAFIDLAGYHELAKGQEPSDRIRTLNANFEVIVPAVMDRGGVVDKFMGDAVMAIFRGENHERRGLEACLDVRSQLRSLAARAARSDEANSPFALGVSIGVATGEMLSGEIGSKAFGRLDYTVLGATPRIAGRLELAAHKNQILVDRQTFEAGRNEFDFVPAMDVELKEGGPAYELVRRSDPDGANAGVATMAETIDLTFPTDGTDPNVGPIRTRTPI